MLGLQFALIREGTSDDALATLIRLLLAKAGVLGAIGAARDYRGTAKEKLQKVLAEQPAPDLIFVHRDSDSRDPTSRRDEIMLAAEELGCVGKVVPVVPVQETEAWLLTDESAIRAVVGRPGGTVDLRLPSRKRIEDTADPKQILKDACLTACGKNGARLKKESRKFAGYRATLLERLDIDGLINDLPSWRQFVADLGEAAERYLVQAKE